MKSSSAHQKTDVVTLPEFVVECVVCVGSVRVCSHREFFDRILAVQGALLRTRVPNFRIQFVLQSLSENGCGYLARVCC